MKLKNGDIWASKETLEAVSRLPADKLSWKGKYWLAKLGRIMAGPLHDIDVVRSKLIQQYGEKTETGFTVKVGEQFNQFQTQFVETLDIETEIDWKPVALTDKDAEALTVEQMMVLDRFVAFPEPSEMQEPSANGVAKDAEAVVKK